MIQGGDHRNRWILGEIQMMDLTRDLFGDEEKGPPSLSDQELRNLDRKAMVTEIDRLMAMNAVQRTQLFAS